MTANDHTNNNNKSNMESPSLSRTASATFRSRRRSHTNVNHLSLAPLAPKYPVGPADYDAYFDPGTSELHTSTSLSQIAYLPSPGGILTNSPALSRVNSGRLRKKPKSSVSIQIPSGAVTSQGYGQKLRVQTDWLVQTGLALTDASRESKGQSWISKRDSSTSLVTEQPRSGTTTPRRRSRRQLSMTPAIVSPVDDSEPDWAEQEGEDDYELDFAENFSDDEEEVRQAISKYKLGQWMDNVVDVMLKLENEQEEDEEDVGDVEPPPKDSKGIWDDAAWFGRLLARTVKS